MFINSLFAEFLVLLFKIITFMLTNINSRMSSNFIKIVSKRFLEAQNIGISLISLHDATDAGKLLMSLAFCTIKRVDFG